MIVTCKKTTLRKLGFLSDQEGIINRYIREEGAWNPHLIKTREFASRPPACSGPTDLYK